MNVPDHELASALLVVLTEDDPETAGDTPAAEIAAPTPEAPPPAPVPPPAPAPTAEDPSDARLRDGVPADAPAA